MVVLTTSRSMKWCRENGIVHVASVEKWIPGANIRRDLFGFIDLIALTDRGIVGIQCFTESTKKAHMDKLIALDRETKAVTAWLSARGRLVLHCWRKRAKAPRASTRKQGQRTATKWECVEIDIDLLDGELVEGFGID